MNQGGTGFTELQSEKKLSDRKIMITKHKKFYLLVS